MQAFHCCKDLFAFSHSHRHMITVYYHGNTNNLTKPHSKKILIVFVMILQQNATSK